MNDNELLWSLLGMAVLAWFFFDSLRARERATALSRQACDQAGVQFLDETVALDRIAIRRGVQGLVWWRRYRFEYCDDRTATARYQYVQRGKGWVILCGMRLEDLKLELETLE
ncbi:DUF3301 domain-containing protein [Gammaproteobacteria bacterium]